MAARHGIMAWHHGSTGMAAQAWQHGMAWQQAWPHHLCHITERDVLAHESLAHK